MKMRQERNSSIELFRILATFLVLIVHWNGWFVGGIDENASWGNFSAQMGGANFNTWFFCMLR